MSQDERVLCIGSHHLEHLFKFYKITSGFLPASLCSLYHISNLANSAEYGPLFLARSQCENDKRFRQLCSYTVCNSFGLVFSYERGQKGGEPRLHRRRSIGVGGHISEHDFRGDTVNPFSLETACRRELDEEVEIQGNNQRFVYVGVILCTGKEESDVELVHAGLVYELRASSMIVRPREDCLINTYMRNITQIKYSAETDAPYERWSQVLFDNIEEPLATFFH